MCLTVFAATELEHTCVWVCECALSKLVDCECTLNASAHGPAELRRYRRVGRVMLLIMCAFNLHTCRVTCMHSLAHCVHVFVCVCVSECVLSMHSTATPSHMQHNNSHLAYTLCTRHTFGPNLARIEQQTCYPIQRYFSSTHSDRGPVPCMPGLRA